MDDIAQIPSASSPSTGFAFMVPFPISKAAIIAGLVPWRQNGYCVPVARASCHDRSAPAHSVRDRAEGPVALHLDDPQRQPPPRQPGRHEGWRAPILVGL